MQVLDEQENLLLSGRRLLVVDDDPVFVETASQTLEATGAVVFVEEDGAAAIEFLENNDCDLLIVDLIMPKVDGFRLISLLRHTRKTRLLPIIVVTSRRDQKAYRDTVSMDISAYLTKPLIWREFPLQVYRALA